MFYDINYEVEATEEIINEILEYDDI